MEKKVCMFCGKPVGLRLEVIRARQEKKWKAHVEKMHGKSEEE